MNELHLTYTAEMVQRQNISVSLQSHLTALKKREEYYDSKKRSLFFNFRVNQKGATTTSYSPSEAYFSKESLLRDPRKIWCQVEKPPVGFVG